MALSHSKSRRSPRRWRPNRSKSLPKSCFLGSDYSYPICPVGKRSPSCRGVIAAYSRAATVAGRARMHGTRGGARARSVMRKASALRKKHGCEHTWDTFKRKSRSRKGSKKSLVLAKVPRRSLVLAKVPRRSLVLAKVPRRSLVLAKVLRRSLVLAKVLRRSLVLVAASTASSSMPSGHQAVVSAYAGSLMVPTAGPRRSPAPVSAPRKSLAPADAGLASLACSRLP
jgi:hypothetical protein